MVDTIKVESGMFPTSHHVHTLFDLSVGRLVGWLVGRFVCLFSGWLFGWLVGRFVSWSDG